MEEAASLSSDIVADDRSSSPRSEIYNVPLAVSSTARLMDVSPLCEQGKQRSLSHLKDTERRIERKAPVPESIAALERSTRDSVGSGCCSPVSSTNGVSRSALHIHAKSGDSEHYCAVSTAVVPQKVTNDSNGERHGSTFMTASGHCVAPSIDLTRPLGEIVTVRDKEGHLADAHISDAVEQGDERYTEDGKVCIRRPPCQAAALCDAQNATSSSRLTAYSLNADAVRSGREVSTVVGEKAQSSTTDDSLGNSLSPPTHHACESPPQVKKLRSPYDGNAKNIKLCLIRPPHAGRTRHKSGRCTHVQQITDLPTACPLFPVTASDSEVNKDATSLKPTTEVSSSPSKTALCEPASEDTISTAEGFFSPHCVSGTAKPTPHTTSVEFTSTSSFSLYSSIGAVRTLPPESMSFPPGNLTGEGFPRPSVSQESKCVLGSFEDTDHSDSRSQNGKSQTDQRRAHEQGRPADAFFESSSNSPVHPSDNAAVDPLRCNRISETTAPSRVDTTSSLLFSASLSDTIPVSRVPPMEKRPRIPLTCVGDAALPRTAAEDRPCSQSEADQNRTVPPHNTSAAVACRHHTSGVVPCSKSASRPRQRRENASSISGRRRRPLQGRFFSRGPESTDSLRNKGKLSQREFTAESSSLTPSPNSSPSSSGTSHRSRTECTCRPIPAHGEDTGYSGESTRTRKITTSRREEADSDGPASLLPGKRHLQQAVQQHSGPVTEMPEHRYTDLPQRRPVNMNYQAASHTELSYGNGREANFLEKNERTPSSREAHRKTVVPGEQQPSFSVASNVQPEVTSPESRRVRGKRRHRGEHATFVMNELQQLQQLCGRKLAGANPVRRKSLQHRFRQLQSALQQLLSSSDAEGTNSCEKRAQLKIRSVTANGASGSRASPAPCAQPRMPHRSTTSRCEEIGEPVNTAQNADNRRTVRRCDTVAERTFLQGSQTGFMSEEKPVSHDRQGETDSATPDGAESFTSANQLVQRASTSATLDSLTWPAHVVTVASPVHAEQTKAGTQSVLCADEGVSTKNSTRERAREAHAEEHKVEERSVIEGEASCADADNALTVNFRYRDSVRRHSSCTKEGFAESTIAAETVARCCHHRPYDMHELATSIDTSATPGEQNVTQNGVAPFSEVSFSNPGKTGYPKSIDVTPDADTHQAARDGGNGCQHSSSIMNKADSSQCSDHSATERDIRDHGSITNGHARKGDNRINHSCESSQTPKRSSPTVTASCANEETPSSAAVNYNIKVTCVRPLRRKRVVCFRMRSRRRRQFGVRHLSQGCRRPVSAALQVSPETYKGGEVETKQQRVYNDDTLLCHRLPGEGDYITPRDKTKPHRPTELSVAVPPSVGTGEALSKTSSHSGDSPTAKSCSPHEEGRYRRDATSSEPSSRRCAKEDKPKKSTNALNKATDFMSTQHSQGTTTGNGDGGTGDASGAHREHKTITEVQPAACRDETTQAEAASASSASAELVQAMYRFVQRQFAGGKKSNILEDEESVGRLPGSAHQPDSAKDGESWPTELCEKAHPGLLLAACFGIVAGYGGVSASRDLCKLLVTPTTEQKQEGEPGSAKTFEGEGEVLHKAAESRSHNVVDKVLPRQATGALIRKTTLPPGGWTAGRAATRSAQKEHKQQQHQKQTEDQDGTQEGCRHLESTSLLSVIQHRPTRTKVARCIADAVTWDHSRHTDKSVPRPGFREGGGIRWELLRTAKRAARRREREDNALAHPTGTEQHSSSSDNMGDHKIREDQDKSTMSPHDVRPDLRPFSNGRSLCSSIVHLESGGAAGTSRSNTHTVDVPTTCSQLSASQRNSVDKQKDPLQERSRNNMSTSRSCTPQTDDDNFCAEDPPSFDDIFNLHDLIPDAWYEEAEEGGDAGDSLKLGTARSDKVVTEDLKEAGQWVLEPPTSALVYGAQGEEDNFQPGFFRMVLEEKECASPSEVSLDRTPGAGDSFSQLPALWNVPDDLVELIDSVPGGSPSALRPPCALRLLPTSSSSSSPSSQSTSRSSLNNSSTSSVPSSAASSSASASSPSRPSSAASSPSVEGRSDDKGVPLFVKEKPSVNNCPFKMLTQHSPAGMRWIFESSSEYDEQLGDVDSSHSEGELAEDVTGKNENFQGNHICEDDRGEPTANTTLNYTGGVGFFQRALAHEGVRSRFNQPLPEFISLCYRKNTPSPNQKRKTAKRKEILCNRRSRTQPPPTALAPDRAKKSRKHRRRRRREECLKLRLAALHRNNLSHKEYMGQFARRMSLTAVHKVFCIELTKAEHCILPYTGRSGDASLDTRVSAPLTARNNALATVTSPWSALGEASPSSQGETVDEGSGVQENRAVGLCKAPPTPPVLTIEGCIADQLRQRGWVMNRLLSDSHFFDLKWKLSDVDEDYRSLRREQFFNHFQNNRVITTKGGLARSLRRLAVEEQVHVDLFFPRCYHLSSLDECSDFLLDYSRCEALTVLLAYLRCYQATPDEFHGVMASEPLPSNSSRRSAALLLWMAYHIASVWLHELNPDLYLDRTESIEQQGRLDPQRLEVFASHAWHFRSQTQAFLREWHAIAQCEKALNDTFHNGETSEDEAALSFVKEGKLFSWSTKNLSRAPLGSQVLRLLKQLQRWWPLWQLERGNCNLENLRAGEEASGMHEEAIGRKESAHETEQKLRGNPENGLESRSVDPLWKQHNVWIMKPSSNSKASGIHCLNNPWEILRAVSSWKLFHAVPRSRQRQVFVGVDLQSSLPVSRRREPISRQHPFIALSVCQDLPCHQPKLCGRGLSDRLIQKYVERPLLLPCRRKFDMRQWVLVRSFDPLQVYVFSTLYLRLCSETYDLRDLQNRFRHVSNRHLNKLNSDTQQVGSNATTKDTHVYPASYGTSHAFNGAATGLDSCQPLAELEAMLGERTGNPQFFQENVMPQIRHIVLQTVRAARPSVISRPNSFELYGFDILLDEAYRAWLIEVNLSPACAASADWQKQMVKQMTGELLDLVFRNDSSGALYGADTNSSGVGHWTLVFDESVNSSEALRAFPPLEPVDETLAAGCIRVRDNPFLQFYSQPAHRRRGSVLAPRAVGGVTGFYPAGMRAEDRSKISQVVGSAAASWDKMVVVGEHLPRQAEAALNSWCCFTEAKNRIIGWWRRTAWKRRAARRKKLALCEDVEVDCFFGLF